MSGLVYFDGRMVPWENATIHVASACARYGANVFEGICYYRSHDEADGYLFRLEEHFERLAASARLMRIEHKPEPTSLTEALEDCLASNRIAVDAHLRLSLCVVGEGGYDIRGPAMVVCTVMERSPSTLTERSVRACISSWRRIDDASMPPRMKAGPNYHNSRLALIEAQENGYDEAVLLNAAGKVAESTNSCFMMIRKGTLITPPVSAGILESVSRDTLMKLAGGELGVPVEVRDIDRSEVYSAEEALFCNSFEEVRPVTSIDRILIGDGKVGPLTRALWAAYEAAVRGANPDRRSWLTAVPPAKPRPASA